VLTGGLPVALVLAWVFDITPAGIARTSDRDGAAVPARPPPEHSIAVLPLANLSQEAENEYFSDGLSEEIRNQLARVTGLRVAARTSSFAFKGRAEDVREIGRRLNVASVLEGGVRKQADRVRIDLQLVSTGDGYQIWSQSFERRLDDIFRLQSEIAAAVIAAIIPRKRDGSMTPGAPATRNFDAYNLYLLGRHLFHRRTEASLARAVECFEQAIAVDPRYALAYSGLADAHTLLSSGYYGNRPVATANEHALPAALRALELEPDLAEAHASLGLIRENEGDLAGAAQALERALELNPGYTMAHVWYGLVLTAQGRYAEAAARNREAFRLDPLSPIVNTNVGFDALRFGDAVEAEARFRAAMDIEPAFPVPYSGMARLNATRGDPREALRWLDLAIERAPTRAFYFARRGLVLLQLGDVAAAAESIERACCSSPDNAFDSELVIGLRIVQGDRDALERIARAETPRAYTPAQRGQAHIALGDLDRARALYDATTGTVREQIDDVINDDWIWRLPHVVNRAHLRLRAGDARGRHELEQLLAELERTWSQGIVNMDTLYWAASAHAVLGQREHALAQLEEAQRRGWRHTWWARCDWNMQPLADDPHYRALLERG
jgi:TolB-like protein/Tfp pilus assembly protein PilF